MVLPETPGGLLTLSPLYEYLKEKGCEEDGECIVVDGVPVQFLPAYNALVEEALSEAVDADYESVTTRVIRAEFLIAICVQTGREKDRQRVAMFMEHGDLDRTKLDEILQRHKLSATFDWWTT